MERPNGRDNEITRWTNEIPTIWRAIKSVDKPDDKIEPSWKIGRNLFSIPSPPPRRSKTIFDAVFRRFRPTIRCRERVLPASKHNPDFFPPSLAAKFFPGKTRFPFQMTARQVPHTARVLFARVNGRKLPKIAGNGCAGVAPPDEHHERRGRRWADGRAIVSIYGIFEGIPNYTGIVQCCDVLTTLSFLPCTWSSPHRRSWMNRFLIENGHVMI